MQAKRDTYANIKKNIQSGDVIAFSGEGLTSELVRLVTRSEEVSHVGVVLSTHLSINGESEDDCFHVVAEANASGVRIISLRSLLSEYDGKLWWLPLSCESRQRLQPNLECFHNFLLSRDGSSYDYESAITEGFRELITKQNLFLRLGRWLLDRLQGKNIPWSFAKLLSENFKLEDIWDPEDARIKLVNWFIENRGLNDEEDVKKYFCSELVMDALQRSGVFGDIERIDPETVNPLELCQFTLYQENYVHLQPEDSDQPDAGLSGIEGFRTKDPSQWRG